MIIADKQRVLRSMVASAQAVLTADVYTQVTPPEKVSGQALYAADVLLPGMLWGKVLCSPYPHANIVRIDTATARHAALQVQRDGSTQPSMHLVR